jgi:hypothetical protein
MVFLTYAAYLVDEFFFNKKPLTVTDNRSEPSPYNALLGLIFIGGPSLVYAVIGRFPFQSDKPQPVEPTLNLDEGDNNN